MKKATLSSLTMTMLAATCLLFCEEREPPAVVPEQPAQVQRIYPEQPRPRPSRPVVNSPRDGGGWGINEGGPIVNAYLD